MKAGWGPLFRGLAAAQTGEPWVMRPTRNFRPEPPMPNKSPTSSRALYLIDLSERMQRMEAGGERMDPLAYRLFARRLRQALVGCSAAELPAAVKQPLVLREALADRHFAEFGRFAGSPRAARIAADVLQRLKA